MLNAEQYVLAKLGEECGEIQQAIGKATLFGLHDVGPHNEHTNLEDIRKEVHDLLGAYMILMTLTNSTTELEFELIKDKMDKIAQWAEYSVRANILKQSESRRL